MKYLVEPWGFVSAVFCGSMACGITYSNDPEKGSYIMSHGAVLIFGTE